MDKKNKYFYFDLDGTLLNAKREISQASLLFLKEFSKNNKIGFITGRPYCMIKNIIANIKPSLPTISSNGAHAVQDNKSLWVYNIKQTTNDKIFKYLSDINATYGMYSTTTMYFKNGWASYWPAWIKGVIKKLPQKYQWNFVEVDQPQQHINKFLCLFGKDHIAEFNKFKNYLQNFDDIFGVPSMSGVMDVMVKQASKGKALKKIAELGIIDLAHTIVFGDNDNDLSMFAVAGLSVAMKNSDSAIKNMANHVTKHSNDDDGVIKYLERLNENNNK